MTQLQEASLARSEPITFFKAGFPTCCEEHARRCFMVIWHIGPDHDMSMSIKMGLN